MVWQLHSEDVCSNAKMGTFISALCSSSVLACVVVFSNSLLTGYLFSGTTDGSGSAEVQKAVWLVDGGLLLGIFHYYYLKGEPNHF